MLRPYGVPFNDYIRLRLSMKPVAYIDNNGVIHNPTDEPDFVKLYFKHVASAVGLTGGSYHAFCNIVSYMGWDNSVFLTKERKSIIAVSCGWVTASGAKTVEKHIKELVSHGFMARVCRGHYKVNPHVVAKGTWVDIKEMQTSGVGKIKFSMTFSSSKGTQFDAEITKGVKPCQLGK